MSLQYHGFDYCVACIAFCNRQSTLGGGFSALHCFWLLPADIVTVVAYALDWFALSIECGNKDTIQWQGR